MTVATTHYTELKALAHATNGMENAALEVDPVTMAPTYHLTVGIPGGSNALATASRLGLPADIVRRARDMLPQSSQEIEALLTYLATEQRNIGELRCSLEKELKEAQRRNEDLKEKLRRLEEDRRRIVKETRDQIVREAANLQVQIRQAATELRKEKSREGIERAKRALADAQAQLNAGLWQPRPALELDEQARASSITAGDTVWLKDTGVSATVLSVSEERGLVEVHTGKIKMTLKLDSVEKKIQPTGGTKKASSAVIAKRLSKPRISLELDLRGKKAEEVEPVLDEYLNEASLSGLKQVRIIHGIGTGTVRQIVRQVLASHPLVTSFRPGEQTEGGDGATIVNM